MNRKFRLSPEQIQRLMTEFLAQAIRVTITHEVKGACKDPKNDHVLECAKKAHAHIIVSGDKDLLTLEQFEGIRIMTARQYIEGTGLFA